MFYGTPERCTGWKCMHAKASRAGRRNEHPAGRAGVRLVAKEHPEDAAVFPSARLFAEEPGAAAETGTRGWESSIRSYWMTSHNRRSNATPPNGSGTG